MLKESTNLEYLKKINSSDINNVSEWLLKNYPKHYIAFFKNGLFIVFDSHIQLIPFITHPAVFNSMSWIRLIKEWSNCEGILQHFILCLNAFLAKAVKTNIEIMFDNIFINNDTKFCFNTFKQFGIINFKDESSSSNLIRLCNDAKNCILSYICTGSINKIYKVQEPLTIYDDEIELIKPPT